MLEETGIDIVSGEVSEINESTGEHEKTLRDTGERVLVKMTFYDYRIVLSQNAENVIVRAEDDWTNPKWFAAHELGVEDVGLPTGRTLQKIGFLTS